MKIEQIVLDELIPYANNARTHSEEQVLQIASSIKEFGFNAPVLIDKDKGIIAGHGRIMAAKKLGLKEAPCIRLEHLTEAQKKAYILADNRIAMNSEWDTTLLSVEFQTLQDEGFDVSELGFELDEINALLNPTEETKGLTDEDAVPEVPEEPKTKPGDIYQLGRHRLMCGDSTSIDAVENLMDGQKADMVYTDPPYGISIVSKSGKIGGDKSFGKIDGDNVVKANKYAPVAGDDSIEVAIESINIIKILGAKVEIIWGGNYYANSLENSSCWIVWDKDNTGNFADAELAWTNQKTAVRIFKHTWNGMIKQSERGEKRVHPTQKPVALAEWCFDEYGENCKTVLDLFGGSGSTLVACESKNKSGYIMELSPNYCDVIVKRWEDFTGKKAELL
jgi:DNA modification methylase